MGVDFWGVKIKPNVNLDNAYDYWDLIEGDDVYDHMDDDLTDFISRKNDKAWKRFCHDVVGVFVGGDPIYQNSKEDINELANKLNELIKDNPKYEYKYDEWESYSNEDVRKFIKYINIVRDNGFVLWVSY